MKKNPFPRVLFFIFLTAAPSSAFGTHEKILAYGPGFLSVNRNTGFEVYDNGSGKWVSKNTGLPVKIVYPFSGSGIRKITSVNISPFRSSDLSLTTVNSLYLSGNKGEEWEKISLSSPVRTIHYLTASAVGGGNGDNILLGTSFSGLFESTDRGRTWKSLGSSMQVFSRGAGFFEDISAVAYGSGKNYLYMATGFSRKLYSLTASGEWLELDLHPGLYGTEITSLVYSRERRELEVYSGGKKFILDTEYMEWRKNPETLPFKETEPDLEAEKRRAAASGKTGIYIPPWASTASRIDIHLDFIEANGMNSIVIDFKDDNGIITYNTELEFPRKIGAVNSIIDIRDLIARVRSRNIYIIARLVVFKDEKLYSYDSGKYAVRDRNSRTPWGHFVPVDEGTAEQREFWVDPFSADVWDYNISVAEELERLGVDEIQFDYIRFPTDGNTSEIEYSHRQSGMLRSEALESFLQKARQALTIPVSTDLYGFNSWYKKGNWNGQQIDMIADYVDVICPMFYPSHFPRDFMPSLPYLEKAEAIYREGTARTRAIASGRSIVRPFVQAFLIGNERNFERQVYTRYLKLQLEGLFASQGCGFTLWNASGNYYMVDSSMKAEVHRGAAHQAQR